MSNFKFSSNLFIELAEIEKIKKFLVDDGYKKYLNCLINNYGIVKLKNQNNPLYPLAPENGGFKVKIDPNNPNNVIVSEGIAIDTKLHLIIKETPETFNIPNDGVKKWLILEYNSHHFENGTISMTMSGQVTGVNTEFTKILRGYNNFPNKIKVESNNQTFEVVDVIDDTTAFVKNGNYGTTFNNERFSVIGAFTPGFIPNSSDLLIYEYDSNKVTLLSSPTPPILNQDQYLLASVEYDQNNVLIINDERTDFFNYDNEYIGQINNDFFSLVTTAVVDKPVKLNSNILNDSFWLELNFQFCCNICQQNIADLNHQLIINQIECNALNDVVPSGNDIFKDYWLYNRANGKLCKINSSVNNSLYFDVDDDFWTISPDLCILPKNFDKYIEIELKNEGSPNNNFNPNLINGDLNTYIFDSTSKNVKITIPILTSDDPNITYNIFVNYRFWGEKLSYQKFIPIPSINFTNYMKLTEVIDNNGGFKITPALILNHIIENYS